MMDISLIVKSRKLILIALLCLSVPAFGAEVNDISSDQLKSLISSGVTVIDVRTPAEWHQTGIVEGSIPIMFFDEKRKPHPQEWLDQATKYVQPDEQVAIICRSGNRSKIIGNYLIKQHGFQSVYNVKGGIIRWVKDGNTTVKVK